VRHLETPHLERRARTGMARTLPERLFKTESFRDSLGLQGRVMIDTPSKVPRVLSHGRTVVVGDGFDVNGREGTPINDLGGYTDRYAQSHLPASARAF